MSDWWEGYLAGAAVVMFTQLVLDIAKWNVERNRRKP